eukprot:g26486.t2
MEARAVSRAIVKGQHFAEITVLLDNGELSTLLGPARRNRPEALKDCLELRKVAMKCTDDSKLLILKKRKKELEDVTWTVKDLGGRLLDGAEGPPPGFKPPSWMPQADAVSSTPLGYVSPGKYRAPVKPTAKEEESVYSFKTRKLVECAEADVKELVSSGDWESKAKVALQQAFKKFGPVLEIRVDFKSDDGEKVASVRFASAKAVELAMSKALRGWLPVGDKHVRVRQPAVEAKAEWRTFVAPRRAAPALESAPNKKRLRPNERFANKKDVEDEETNNFDAQTGPHSQATPKADELHRPHRDSMPSAFEGRSDGVSEGSDLGFLALVLEVFMDLLPVVSIGLVLRFGDLRLWCQTMFAAALLMVLKGFASWATVVPDKGWKVCQDRLGPDGLRYYREEIVDEFGTRTANLITYEDDAVWEADTAESFTAYASDQWPHFPLKSLVSDEEILRFAKNRGGRFPSPQYCPSAAWTGESGAAILLGDALHSLPPDIGQGVNSALEDVTVLEACFASTDRDGNASDAVREFETRRMPDVEALIKIVRVAAPFQYSQAPWRGRLWNVSFLCRLLLNKALPAVFDLPLFLLIQRSEMSYREESAHDVGQVLMLPLMARYCYIQQHPQEGSLLQKKVLLQQLLKTLQQSQDGEGTEPRKPGGTGQKHVNHPVRELCFSGSFDELCFS